MSRAIVLALLAGLAAAGCWDRKSSPAGATATTTTAAGRKVMTREAFKAAVTGKTPDEIIAAIGRPDDTTDHPDGRPQAWYYRNTVLNPATGKSDMGIVEFEGGVAVNARWV